MSNMYRFQVKIAPPPRPRGVALLATIGILGGLAQLGMVLLIAWLRMRQGIPLGGQLAPLGAGLALAWLTVWINWGLWDMVRWAWWAGVVFGILAAVVCGFALRSVPDLAAFLARGLPEVTARRIEAGLTAELIAILVFSIVAAIYLLTAHKAYGIGVKQKRPLWER